MKRFLGAFLAGVLVMTGFAYGAEKEVRFLREEEVILQDKPICRDGKWMISLADLEQLTETQATEKENMIIFQKHTMLADVELQKDVVAYFMQDKTMLEGLDGITNIDRQVHTELASGEYRMCIPFSYTYYIQGEYVDYLNKKIENGDLCDIDWNYFYSSKWGKPDFYFAGDGVMSTYDLQKTTDYVLYGYFTVG